MCPTIGNVCLLQMEKFVLEVAYRETRPPFWDALISRYRRPMSNCVVQRLYCRLLSCQTLIRTNVRLLSINSRVRRLNEIECLIQRFDLQNALNTSSVQWRRFDLINYMTVRPPTRPPWAHEVSNACYQLIFVVRRCHGILMLKNYFDYLVSCMLSSLNVYTKLVYTPAMPMYSTEEVTNWNYKIEPKFALSWLII